MLFRGDYEEKRDFARMVIDCPAQLYVAAEGHSHTAVVKDLSATGLQLATADNLMTGSLVEVRITPEKAIVPPLHAQAEVVRCEPSGEGYLVGLKIVEMLPPE